MTGRLVDNIMQFARILRGAGLPVGPGQVIEVLRAAQVVGIGNRDDFYWALFATCVTRIEQKPLFDQAFHIFWRNPKLRERLMQMLLPQLQSEAAPQKGEPVATRLAEALSSGARARRDHDRRQPDLVRPRAAPGQGFRPDDHGGAAPDARADRRPALRLPGDAHAALPARPGRPARRS